VSGTGISWAICKSAPCYRKITMPAAHHSVFLQAGCPSCRPTNSVKALKANSSNSIIYDQTVQKNMQQYRMLLTWCHHHHKYSSTYVRGLARRHEDATMPLCSLVNFGLVETVKHICLLLYTTLFWFDNTNLNLVMNYMYTHTSLNDCWELANDTFALT